MSEFTYPTMNTVEDVDKVISGAILAAKTMKRKVQYAAIGCMILAGHEGKDEDGIEWAEHAVSHANYLVEQLGSGVKGEGLVKFLVYMGGFVVNPADKKGGFIRVKGADWIKSNLEAAKDKAWYDYAPPTPYKGWDWDEKLAQFITEAKRAVERGKNSEADAKLISVDVEMMEVLIALHDNKPVTAEHGLRLVEKLLPTPEIAPDMEALPIAANG